MQMKSDAAYHFIFALPEIYENFNKYPFPAVTRYADSIKFPAAADNLGFRGKKRSNSHLDRNDPVFSLIGKNYFPRNEYPRSVWIYLI